MTDLAAVEARIWSILDPYRGRLESSTVYGMPSLKWPGAKAHDYFASVKPATKHVGLYLRVADTYPDALVGASPEFLKRRTGKAAFTFASLDDELASELDSVLARLFDLYEAAHR